MHFSLTTLSFALCLGISNAVAQSDFSASCNGFTTTDIELTADCLDSNGNFDSSDLNLDTCLGNNGGSFVWETNGGFGVSGASNCFLLGTVLNCDLDDGTGTGNTVAASVDLNDGVGNENGQLFC